MKIVLLRLGISLALMYIIGVQGAADADTIPIPVCNFPPCNNDLVFNFDFTNPPQSVPPPYVLVNLQIPVNVLEVNAIVVDLFSGLDASGSSGAFIGGVGPPGPQTLSFLLGSGQGFEGQLDGIFSIGLRSEGTVGTAIELVSPPLATGSAGTCFIGTPSPDCFSVTIGGVQPSIVPEPTTFLLVATAFAGIGWAKRRTLK